MRFCNKRYTKLYRKKTLKSNAVVAIKEFKLNLTVGQLKYLIVFMIHETMIMENVPICNFT